MIFYLMGLTYHKHPFQMKAQFFSHFFFGWEKQGCSSVPAAESLQLRVTSLPFILFFEQKVLSRPDGRTEIVAHTVAGISNMSFFFLHHSEFSGFLCIADITLQGDDIPVCLSAAGAAVGSQNRPVHTEKLWLLLFIEHKRRRDTEEGKTN